MAIIVDRDTRLVVQGITGREGSFHATRNNTYGTNVVAGVTPGKGGADVEGIPVFDSVRAAAEETSPNTAMQASRPSSASRRASRPTTCCGSTTTSARAA
jgi:succinyl-CoA synthetase alpha subunit